MASLRRHHRARTHRKKRAGVGAQGWGPRRSPTALKSGPGVTSVCREWKTTRWASGRTQETVQSLYFGPVQSEPVAGTRRKNQDTVLGSCVERGLEWEDHPVTEITSLPTSVGVGAHEFTEARGRFWKRTDLGSNSNFIRCVSLGQFIQPQRRKVELVRSHVRTAGGDVCVRRAGAQHLAHLRDT